MIDLYTWGTPNGRKASIMLEETGLEYQTHQINILEDDQFKPEFLKISPNNKIPAIVDTDTGINMMESGAILLYLAEKTGQFMPADEAGRWQVMEWLMWQMGGFGPMLGQAHHFLHFQKGKAEYAEGRYEKEAQRLYKVLNARLGESEYLAGTDFTIADIATWPWTTRYAWQQIDFADYPNVKRWYAAIAGRPAVIRGYGVPNPAEIPIP